VYDHFPGKIGMCELVYAHLSDKIVMGEVFY